MASKKAAKKSTVKKAAAPVGRKMRTIDIKGKAYAKVITRVNAAHEDLDDFDIITTCQEFGGGVSFVATITIREKDKTRKYTGHSFGKSISGDKALEKLETVAVGRALAFAGYTGDGDEIASDEEMKMATENQNTNWEEVDAEELADAKKKLSESTNLKELAATYKSFPKQVWSHPDMVELKDALKEKFEDENSANQAGD